MKVLVWTAVLLTAALLAMAAHWAVGSYRAERRPAHAPIDPRLASHGGAHLALQAAARYRALPPHERRALREAAHRSLSDLDTWAAGSAREAGLVCIGERHDDQIREFLARAVLPRLAPDRLMVEAGEDRLAAMQAAAGAGEQVSLLGARFDHVMSAAPADGDPPLLVAVDETAAERARRTRARAGDPTVPGREDTLTAKVRAGWREGARHVLLLGALHCRDVAGWTFHRLAREDARIAAHGMLGVVVMARDQESGAQLLFYLLEEMGIRREVLVIPDLRRFPHEIQGWLLPVADAFAGYRAAILFDARR